MKKDEYAKYKRWAEKKREQITKAYGNNYDLVGEYRIEDDLDKPSYRALRKFLIGK